MIRENKINDVIFAPNALSYKQILNVIGKCREQTAAFHLVPTTMEVIVGKANVHNLEDVPLVQINYNIGKPLNMISKRLFDMMLSGILLLTAYPAYAVVAAVSGRKQGRFIFNLPKVFTGKMSMVGPYSGKRKQNDKFGSPLFLGKPGLCNPLLLQQNNSLSEEEIEQYNIYYARNQSVLLDIEILIKVWLKYREKKIKV